MTKDEELEQLHSEKRVLCERLRRKDEELEQSHQANQDLREGLKQAIMAIESQQEHVKTLQGLIDFLQERVKTLEGHQAKDSHNSSLPPSSDRFVRPPKSLRKKSGKKPGGQKGHRGHHLETALGHRTSCGRKAVSPVLSSDTSPLSSFGEGPSAVRDEHPVIGHLPGGRSMRALCPCEPIVARAAGSPTLGRQYCHLCHHLSSAVGRGG